MVGDQICYLLMLETTWPCVSVRSFAKYLINKAAQRFSKSRWKSYFLKEIICAHQVGQFAKFIAFGFFFNKLILKSPTIAVYVSL